MGTAPFVQFSRHTDLLFASIQQMFAVNSCSVQQTEQTFQQTFAVFVGLNAAPISPPWDTERNQRTSAAMRLAETTLHIWDVPK